jgi:ATP-binding cassette subfamily B protein
LLAQNWAFARIPVSIQRLLDEIVGANRLSVVRAAALAATGFTVLAGGCMFLMRKLIIGVSRRIEYDLRDELFRHLIGLQFGFFQRRRTGDLISRCTNDLTDVRMLLGPGMMYIPDALSRLALFLPLLLGLHVPMTVALLLVAALLVAVNLVVIPRFRPLFRSVQEQVAAINDRTWQTVTGITTVKLYAAEAQQTAQFEELNRGYVRANIRVLKIRGLLWPLLGLVFGLLQLVTLWLGGSAVIQGELSIGELLQFSTMVGLLALPIMSLGWVASLLQQGVSAMERIEVILTARPEQRTGATLPAGGLRCALQRVRYRYPEAVQESLRGIDLQLEPGETVAITGRIGSGKSTVLALLTAIVQPTAGCVTVAGRPLAALDPLALRRRVAVVPQETFLFSMTVAENIAMGAEDAVTREQIEAAAAAAALSADIATFPDGYDQLVGERGITLSGGQKQRLALARALVKQSDLLILDDALSSVDSATETEILAALRVPAGNPARTVLLVSQRTSALRLADRILMLEGGRVVEQGSHEQLLRAGGRYARLAELQRLEQFLT